MKRRNLFRWLLGLTCGGTVASQAKADHMMPMRILEPGYLVPFPVEYSTFGELSREVAYPAATRKTDPGIPSYVDTSTPLCDFMQVCIDRHDGAGEVRLSGEDNVLAVDVVAGAATIIDLLPGVEARVDTSDVFGYASRPPREADPAGPYVVYGDFRIRWKNGYKPPQA